MNGQTRRDPSGAVQLDVGRRKRIGLEEAVYCAGKSVVHIAEILEHVSAADGRILLTRLSDQQLAGLPKAYRERIDFDPVSMTGFFSGAHPFESVGRVAVVAAGTSDAAVAREAARTLTYAGERPLEMTDVGVAGLWRLMDRIDEIRRAEVVIAVAGMDAALPTVVAGLVAAPVIGVPTSVGYGAAEGGKTALKAMLVSCASGLVVTNIDNGYGAACAALRIMRRAI